MNRRNRSIQKCPRHAIIAASHLLFVFTCISRRNIFTSDLSLCYPFSGSCFQTAEAVLLSGSVRSFTHCIRTLISSYHCRTCVGGREFGIIMAESNLDWLSGGFLYWCFWLWSTARRWPVYLEEKRDTGENEDKVRTKTHNNDRKGIRKRKRARLGWFVSATMQVASIEGKGAVSQGPRVPPSTVFVGKEHMKNVVGAQLIYSDSGLDPVTVPASFRQQVSEESRHEWEGRISTDRQEDSVSQELGCSQNQLCWREREKWDERTKQDTHFCLNPQTQKLSVFGNRTQCANTAEYRRPSSAFSWLHVLPLQSRLHLQLSRSAKGSADFLKVANAIQAECEPEKSLEAQTWPECFPEEQFFLR